RNDNVTFFVMNNNLFAMTGGQLAPTTQIGQYTASTPSGRSIEEHGAEFDVVKVMRNLDIAYLARTTITNPAEVSKTKQSIRKALEKQRDHKGFSLVEVLVPCPTNWNLTPPEAMNRITKELMPHYEMGEIIDR
ncbi:MAG: thiamine pyrophosphate-dependent enzyme, partial [Clostridia bacterium]